MPEFDNSEKNAPVEKPSMPKTEVKPLTKAEPSPAPSADIFNELAKKPSQPPKKNDVDFTLEDIIAEFKD